jgi:hypothetical protein
MLRHLDSLFSPAGRGARRADEGAREAGLSNNVHASFGRDGIVSTVFRVLGGCACGPPHPPAGPFSPRGEETCGSLSVPIGLTTVETSGSIPVRLEQILLGPPSATPASAGQAKR